MTRKIGFFTLILLAALSGAARKDAWEVIGPGGGGAQFFPAVSPQNSDEVFVACDMTGAYVSHDGGSTWRMFNLGQVVKGFTFDPSDAHTVYARSAGERADGRGGSLWRSTDAGDTWRLVYPDPSTVTGVFENSDHATTFIASSGDSPGEIEALAVDPAIRTFCTQPCVEITPRGCSSPKTGAKPGIRRRIWMAAAALYIDHNSSRGDRTLYVIGQNSVAVRRDGVWRRGAVPAGVSSFLDADLGFASDKPVIYAVTKSTVYVSDDGGAAWRESKLPGDSSNLRAIATSAAHGDVAYLSYSRLSVGGARYFGVAKTTDAGRTWTLVWKETSSQPANNIHDGWITARLGPSWGENPLNLAVSASDPNLCIATDMGRTMRTRDGGKTWEGVYSRRLDDQSSTTTGLDVTTNYGVHFDPFDRQRLFITYTDIGMFRSENGGRGWVSATETVPRAWTNTTYWMVFDPKVRGRAWAVVSGVHDLPRPKMWRNRSTATYDGGVVISDDGGRTWHVSNQGMPQTAATHILLDASSPEDARVLYVTGFGRGVFKSTDGGKSWELRNDGLPQNEPFAWRLAQGPGSCTLRRARAAQRGRNATAPATTALSTARRCRGALEQDRAAHRRERAERNRHRPEGSRATVPRGVGPAIHRAGNFRRCVDLLRRRRRRGAIRCRAISTSTM